MTAFQEQDTIHNSTINKVIQDMDITYADSDFVDQHEYLGIHLFYYLFDFDYRRGMFTDESSIYDMGNIMGLTHKEIEEVADQYDAQKDDSLIYSECYKKYNKLLNAKWDAMLIRKLQEHYGITLEDKKHYLVDIMKQMLENFPNRDWETENIFIMKKLDAQNKREEEEELKKQKESKVIRLGVRKKLTKEETLACTNPFLIKEELGISMKEARELAQKNYDLKMKDRIFTPYRPLTTDKK